MIPVLPVLATQDDTFGVYVFVPMPKARIERMAAQISKPADDMTAGDVQTYVITLIEKEEQP